MMARISPPPANEPPNKRRWPGGTPGSGETANNAIRFDLANGLVYWFQLSQAGALYLADSSEAGFGGVLLNAGTVLYNADDPGTYSGGGNSGSAYFDGANDLTLNTIASQGGLVGGNWSFHLWVKLDDKTQNRTFLVYEDSGHSSTILQILYRQSDDRIVARLKGISGSIVDVVARTLGSPSAAQWYAVYVQLTGNVASISVKAGIGTEPIYTESYPLGGGSALRTTFPYGHLAQPLPATDSVPFPDGSVQHTNGSGFFRIGSIFGGSANHFGKIVAVGAWGRALNAIERSDLLANDYGVVRIWPAGDPSNDISAALAPPTAVSFAGGVLSWTNGSATRQIEIWQSTDSTGVDYQKLATVAAGSTSYTPANSSAVLFRKVRHIRDRGSPSAFAIYTPAPQAPVIIICEQLGGINAHLIWTHPGQVDSSLVDSYTIQLQTNGGGWSDWKTGLVWNDSEWTDTAPAIPGDTVEFRMKATKGGIDSPWSNTAGIDPWA